MRGLRPAESAPAESAPAESAPAESAPAEIPNGRFLDEGIKTPEIHNHARRAPGSFRTDGSSMRGLRPRHTGTPASDPLAVPNGRFLDEGIKTESAAAGSGRKRR